MEEREIMYCFDPLCGWCYGFGPVIQQLEAAFKDKIQFNAYAGGMVTGERVTPIGETFSYIKNALQTVEQRTGITFGQGFKELLEEGTYLYNSEPPSIALVIYKSVSQGSSIALAHQLQHAIFYDGHSLNEPENLGRIVQEAGLDEDVFLQLFQQEKYRDKTYEEFAFVQRLGVSGFPALLYREGRKLYALSRGFQSYEPLEEMIGQLLEKNAKDV
jgi:putative protein-disulfide isomerase